jgi:phosphatidylglycerol:prolipoprotein diacylglycerol transferase
LENFDLFTRSDLSFGQNFLNMVNIREGGLTFYGGLMLATPCCILYAMYHRIPILLGMDIVAPVLMIGLGVGRIGCFMNGCCYGERCDLPDQSSSIPWGVRFPYYSNAYFEQWMLGQIAPPAELVRGDAQHPMLLNPGSAEVAADPELRSLIAQTRALPVQPAQIYSCITAFLLAGVLLAFFTLGHINGRVFALMLMLEGVSRFILEILRVEPSVTSISIGRFQIGFSLSMVLGLLSLAAGIAMWFAVRWQPNRYEL